MYWPTLFEILCFLAVRTIVISGSVVADLEIEDLVNGTPYQGTSRTPGQLLSLTSHLSFVSRE